MCGVGGDEVGGLIGPSVGAGDDGDKLFLGGGVLEGDGDKLCFGGGALEGDGGSEG